MKMLDSSTKEDQLHSMKIELTPELKVALYQSSQVIAHSESTRSATNNLKVCRTNLTWTNPPKYLITQR
jgi:hypothetical protein